MPLTPLQQDFLVRYALEQGLVTKALDALHISDSTFSQWREDREFNAAYRDTYHQVVTRLDGDNHLLALQHLQHTLTNGVVEEVLDVQKTTTTTGKHTIKVKKRVKRTNPSPALIHCAMRDLVLIKAINVLLHERVIPPEIAKKLINAADRISTDMVQAFQEDPEISQMNDKKVIALIKSAVLGD